MKPLSSEPESFRPDILHLKHIYGAWFGIVLGLTYAIFVWGIDGYRLAQINGLYPWLKFLVAVVPCMLVGGLAGWLSARSDKPLIAMFLWVTAAAIFAWLAVNLPLQIAPRILKVLEPDLQSLLHYTYYEEFSARFGVAYFWLAVCISLAGLLQIPMSDSAISGTSLFGKISPMLLGMALMMISGITMDNLNNQLLREPVHTVNSAVEVLIENQGKEIDPLISRQLHLASFRTVSDVMTPERKFIVSGYSALLEEVQVLGQFEDAWVECELLYNQLLSCKQVQVANSQ
jgi:hypothetical protein